MRNKSGYYYGSDWFSHVKEVYVSIQNWFPNNQISSDEVDSNAKWTEESTLLVLEQSFNKAELKCRINQDRPVNHSICNNSTGISEIKVGVGIYMYTHTHRIYIYIYARQNRKEGVNKDKGVLNKGKVVLEWFGLTLLPTVHQLVEFVLWNGNRAIKKKRKQKKRMQQTIGQNA